MSQFCTFLPKISLYLNFKIIFHVIFEYVKKKKSFSILSCLYLYLPCKAKNIQNHHDLLIFPVVISSNYIVIYYKAATKQPDTTKLSSVIYSNCKQINFLL